MTGGLRLRERERLRFFFFVAMNCLMNVGLTIGVSVSEGLFLSRSDLGPTMLPAVFIGTAMTTVCATVLYASYVDKVRNDRYFQIMHACALVVLIALLVGMRTNRTWAFMAFYGFYYVVQSLFNTHYWNYAADYFDAVEAKRLFPFFPLGNSIGGFVGGVLASLLSERVAPISLAALWAVLLGLNMALIAIVSPRLRGWVVSESEEADEASLTNVVQGFAFLNRSAMGRWHIAYALVMVTSLFFLQFLYSDVLAHAYPDAERLTAFIGRFLAVTNIVEVILELTFTPRLIESAGVGASNVFYPLSTLLGFVLLGSLRNVAAATYSRMNRETFDNAISGACRNLLYNAYPSRFRGRIRAFIEGAVTNAGTIIAGTTMLVLGRFLSPERLPGVVMWLGVGASLVFLFIALAIRHQYLNTLVHGLKDYRLDFEDVNLELDKVKDDELHEMLPQIEDADDPGSVAIVTRILGVLASRGALEPVVSKVSHTNPEVQIAAINVLSGRALKSGRPRLDDTLEQRLEAALNTVVEEVAAHPEARARALEALSVRRRPLSAERYLADGAPEVRAAAATLLVSDAQRADELGVWEVIDGMLSDGQAEVRTAILRRLPVDQAACRNLILAHVHDEDADVRQAVIEQILRLDPTADEVTQRVQPLLTDRNEEVRAAMVRFLSRSGKKALLGDLAARLHDDAIVVRRAAVETLRRWGDQVVPHVEPFLDAPSTHTVDATLSLLGGLPSKEVRDKMRAWLLHRLDLAHDAVIAECVMPAVMRAVTTRLDPMDALGLESARVTTEPLAILALRDFVGRVVQHVLEGLESLEDPTVIRNIRRCLETSLRQARGDAMEALSNLREHAVARGLLLLLDDGSPEERLTVSLGYRHLAAAPPWERISDGLLCHPDRWIRVASAILAEQTEPGSGGREYLKTEEYAVMKHLLFLKKVPLFGQMSLEQIEVISRIVNEVNYYRGEVIFKESEIGDKLYIIAEGKVSVVKGHRTAGEVTLATLKETDYFGEMSVLDNEPRSATIVVDEDSRLLSISGEKLRDIVHQKPEIAFEIFKVLSTRLRRADQKLAEMARDARNV